jgi:hypothetical protein
MPVQECGLDAAGRSICLSWSGKYWNDLTVLVDGGIVARVPDLEELKSGKEIILKDGTVLKIQVVGTNLQVTRNGRPLSGGQFMAPEQHPSSLDGHVMSAEQHPSSSDGSRRNRTFLFLIIFLTILLLLGVAFSLPITQLMSSGIAVQGKIVNVGSDHCDGYGWFGEPISVQFTDQAGQVDTSTFSQCDYGTSYENPGESITIVYDPHDPLNIAPRDELAGTYLKHTLIIVAIGLFELALLLGLLSEWMVRRIRKRRRTRSMSDPTQGNWLTSKIKNSKVTAIFSETMLCRMGLHQGTWTTEGRSGCLQRRFCIYCRIPQQRERHAWPVPPVYEYFQHSSCETRMTCLRCGKTKFTGVKHEDRQSGEYYKYCKRCGENYWEWRPESD